jgi:hypothetical protein
MRQENSHGEYVRVPACATFEIGRSREEAKRAKLVTFTDECRLERCRQSSWGPMVDRERARLRDCRMIDSRETRREEAVEVSARIQIGNCLRGVLYN